MTSRGCQLSSDCVLLLFFAFIFPGSFPSPLPSCDPQGHKGAKCFADGERRSQTGFEPQAFTRTQSCFQMPLVLTSNIFTRQSTLVCRRSWTRPSGGGTPSSELRTGWRRRSSRVTRTPRPHTITGYCVIDAMRIRAKSADCHLWPVHTSRVLESLLSMCLVWLLFTLTPSVPGQQTHQRWFSSCATQTGGGANLVKDRQ